MKTIKTETHLLLIDETAECSKGKWGIHPYFKNGQMYFNGCIPEILKEDYIVNGAYILRIIAASPKLGDLPTMKEQIWL